MIKEISELTIREMDETIERTHREFVKIRTGRASIIMLDGIKVEYYGEMVPIKQVASISIPEVRTIEIKPWDKSMVKPIEAAVLKSDLGITPMSNGKIVRLNIPLLTEEHRRELTKLVKKIAEESRISVRNIRREAIDKLRKAEKGKKISEDERYKGVQEIQKITTEHIEKVDSMLEAKERQLKEE